VRGHIVIGSALTAAVLTMVAAVISGIVAADQISAKDGTIARGFLVVAALAITAFAWWVTMQPSDRPEALLFGLMGGWLLNVSSWTGHSFIGRLFSDVTPVATLVDLVLWAIVSLGLVALLSRTSTTVSR
jgi:hypothetical protein